MDAPLNGPEPWRGTEHPDEGDDAPWHREWDTGGVWDDDEDDADPDEEAGWPESWAGPEYWLNKRAMEEGECDP